MIFQYDSWDLVMVFHILYLNEIYLLLFMHTRDSLTMPIPDASYMPSGTKEGPRAQKRGVAVSVVPPWPISFEGVYRLFCCKNGDVPWLWKYKRVYPEFSRH